MHKRLRVEVADFSRYVAGIRGGIKGADVVDAGFAGDEVLPESVLTDAVGGDDTQPGNDYTTWVLHLPVPLSGWNGEGGVTPNNLAGNQSKPKARRADGSGTIPPICRP